MNLYSNSRGTALDTTLGYVPQCNNSYCAQYIQQLLALVSRLQYEIEIKQCQPPPASPPTPSRVFAESQTLPLTSTSSPQLTGIHLGRVPDPTDVRLLKFDIQTSTGFRTAKLPTAKRTKVGLTNRQRQTLNSLLEDIPNKEKGWKHRRALLGLSNVEGIVKVLDDIISPGCQAKPSDQSSLRENISAYITWRGSEVSTVYGGLDRLTILSAFNALVFMGECRVAVTLGMEQDHVDKAMDNFLVKSRASDGGLASKTLQMYRNVPKWVTRQANELFTQFGHLASEMFLHAAMTISKYDSLSRSGPDDQIRREIIDTITSADTPALPEPQAELPLYLPFVVWARILLQTGIDCYSRLKDALDSSKQFSQEDFGRWLNIYLQKTSRFPEQEVASELATDPPEPTPKRRRIDPPIRCTSMCSTAVPGQSDSPVQTGDSTPCPFISSNTDESVPDQAGVPMSIGGDVDSMIDTDTVRSGKGLPQGTAERAMLGASVPTFQSFSETMSLTANSSQGFPNFLNNPGVGQMAASVGMQLSHETAGPQPGYSHSPLIDSISEVTQPRAHIGNTSGPADWSLNGDINFSHFLPPCSSSSISGYIISGLVPALSED